MAKIEKITLTIGRKTVELTVDEAKQLKGILAELFGADKVEYVTRDIHHYRDPYKIYPLWWGTTCGTNISLSCGTSAADAPVQTNTVDNGNWLADMMTKFSTDAA